MVFISHPGYTQEKWNTLSIWEQMGNISSEVGRALRAKQANNTTRMRTAVQAALELFNASTYDPKNRHIRREIGRAKEWFLDFCVGDNTYNETYESIDAYFTDFALVARANS